MADSFSAPSPQDATLGSPTVNRVLQALLVAAIILPAVIYRVASFRGEVVAILYREPKKDAIAILCWVLILGFLCAAGRRIDTRKLTKIITDPCVVTLSLMLSYFALTRLWVTVPENWGYEMSQYVLLYLLLLVLLAWATFRPTIPSLVQISLILSIGLVAVIGVIQGLVPGVAPAAINPFGEVGNPSLMGYKNPAALSVMAQIFILAGVAFSLEKRRILARLLLFILLAVELTYLVSLQSRTAYLSLIIGSGVLAVLWPLSSRESARRAMAALTVAVVIVLAGLAVNPRATEKAKSVVHHLKSPRAYLDSDRGTYLANTLNMARVKPFGVGIGDWQTMYPVYRTLNTDTAFNDRFQVRRAHSDHVQVLGEGGWFGLILWLAFLTILVVRTAMTAVRSKDQSAAFLTAQLVAVTTAMCTDFYTEIPYNKFQFFILVFLTINLVRSRHPENESACTLDRRPWLLITALVAAASIAGVATSIQTEKKLIAAATSTSLFLQAAKPDEDPRVAAVLFEEATTIGETWTIRHGYWKTLFRDHLALARSAALTGRPLLAIEEATLSLRLHPFNPDGLRLMAEISVDPVEAALWESALQHVEHSQGTGFRIYHPLGDRYSDMTH